MIGQVRSSGTEAALYLFHQRSSTDSTLGLSNPIDDPVSASLAVNSRMSLSPFFARAQEWALLDLRLISVSTGLRSKVVKCAVSKNIVQYGSPTPQAP